VRRLVPLLVVVALLWAAAPALAKTETSTSGDVTATLTYSGKNPPFRTAHLTISQAGLTVFDAAVRMPCKACGLQSILSRRVMKLRDLDGDSEPEVLLDVYSGGAHCCLYSLVYRFVPSTNTYERIAWPWGNVGYQLRDLNHDRRIEFVSGDDRFAYLFTSYADSLFPITIYQLGENGFADVTRKFRAAVRAHARRLLRFYRRALHDKRDVRGILAAFQADEYLAKRSNAGWRVLRRAARRGQLKSPYGDNTGPSGQHYLRVLRRYLGRWGYAPKSSSSARAAR
jgi:hypothetical protein